MSEVEETLKRIQAHKGVTGVIVVNQEGIVFRSIHCNVWLEGAVVSSLSLQGFRIQCLLESLLTKMNII